MRKKALVAEQAGKDSFTNDIITSHKQAEKVAAKAYTSVLERDCFVAGWNCAFWDNESRLLKASTEC